MSEFRQNFATKEWVIIAPGRAGRPNDFRRSEVAVHELPELRGDCPFCVGNEHRTGIELYREESDGRWLIRVVYNRFSALDPDALVTRVQQGRFLKSGNFGHAEVIIDSPRHNATLDTITPTHLRSLLLVYRNRMAEVSRMANIAIVMLFRNYGPLAGTSLEHPHSQLIASPIIPPHIRDPFQKAALHYDSYGTCAYCDMIEEERSQSDRVFFENEQFIAFCPYAARTPYEMRIYPKRHNASYCWVQDSDLPMFAEALWETLRRMHAVLGSVSYNFLFRTSPVGDEDVRYLHWYFVLVPRIATQAGFEMGSGIYINSVAPEVSAAELRGVTSDSV